MAYQKKTWKDRSTQYPNRIKVINTHDDLDEELLFITRQDAEGTVNVAGDAFSAANMNDLENRVAAAFNEANGLLSTLLGRIYPVGSIFFTMNSAAEDSDQQGKGVKYLQSLFGSKTRWQSLGTVYPGRFLIPVYPNMTVGELRGNSSTILQKNSNGTWKTKISINPALADLPRHNHSTDDYFYAFEEGARAPKTTYNKDKHKDINWPRPDPDSVKVGTVAEHYTTTTLPGGYRYTTYTAARPTSLSGGNQAHSHDFGDNGWMSGTLTADTFNVDISQPYRTVYAWRRLSDAE